MEERILFSPLTGAPYSRIMSETVITVQGRFSEFYAPERATLALAVGFDGPVRDVVFAQTTASSDDVRTRISKLFDKKSGPVVSFANDTLQVWSDRPWNQDGRVLEPVFHARLGFVVKFSDFSALASFIEEAATADGVTVGSLQWDLTETTRSVAIAEVRSRAVKDAVVKATIYAQSIGLGQLKAVAIADEGMLGDVGAGTPSRLMMKEMRMAAASDQGSAPLSLAPEELEIQAIVDARFIAS